MSEHEPPINDTNDLVESKISSEELMQKLYAESWNLRKYIMNRFGNNVESDDVIQMTALALFRANESGMIKYEKAHYTLMYIVAYRTARRMVQNDQQLKRTGLTRRISSLVVDTGETPEEQFLRTKNIDTINEALQSLSESDREVLTGLYLEEVTYSEIAKKLGYSINSIGHKKSRALKRAYRNLNRLGLVEDF